MKTIVIGAGPVGALAAIYAAQRGAQVEVYELRNDLRDPSTTPLNFTKSINLALSERGIYAMKGANQSELVESVMAETIPMRGRMIHGKRVSGELYEEGQDYDIHGRTIYAVDRGGLNKRLLDELGSMPNVKLLFNHKLTGADFKRKIAWFEQRGGKPSHQARPNEIEVRFDFLIGADGAHSSARYHLMKFTRMNYQQEYIDTLWCEFQIPPEKLQDTSILGSKFRISPHHLHIWPGKEYMFIAIPSLDGSFTCTLFLPSFHFATLENDPASLPAFFDSHFPGVTTLISPENLISSFKTNPHLPLISIKCHPYHYSHSAVILGDAAHAMVPFYGQGMNSGLEDVRVLFSILDKYSSTTSSEDNITPIVNPSLVEYQRGQALEEYSATRTVDGAAINDLALQNYIEMRAFVISPVYRLRKFLEEALSVYVPSLGWQTKYSRVSFGNERYSEIIKQSDKQGKILLRAISGAIFSPIVISAAVAWWRWRAARGSTRLFMKWQSMAAWKTT